MKNITAITFLFFLLSLPAYTQTLGLHNIDAYEVAYGFGYSLETDRDWIKDTDGTYHSFYTNLDYEIFDNLKSAQKSERELRDIQQRAIQDAHKDAEGYINTPMWFFIGCAPGVGLFSALVYNPPVPISRFIGKSAEYTFVYAEAYKRKMKGLQFRLALAGCITGGIVGGGALLPIHYLGGIPGVTD